MRYFIGFNPKLTASKFKNAPVSGKKKAVIAPTPQGSPAKMYKMSAGPLKETTVERDMRKAKEAKARWEAKQKAKEESAAIKQAAIDAKVSKRHAELIVLENIRKAYLANKKDPITKAEWDKVQRRYYNADARKAYRQHRLDETGAREKYNAQYRAKYEAKNGGYQRSEETRKKMSDALKAKWAERKSKATATDTTYKGQSDWAMKSVKQRLKNKYKNKSVVITITITDLNKS